jgi:carboxylesterase type B
MRQLLLVFLTASVYGYPQNHSEPQAHTINGTYSGTYLPGLNQDLFLGIPYAKPPVSELRYRPPQYLDVKWNDSRDAKTLPNACPQYPIASGLEQQNVSLHEDCLALNIVKPAGGVDGLPVLVWIHGGSYQNVRMVPCDSPL